MHTESKELRAAALAEVEDLLRDGFPLRAYDLVKCRALGEPPSWSDVDERILAGRLLTPLGASRRSDVLHYLAFRHHPQNGRAALYYGFGLAARFGVLRTLPHLRMALETLEMDENTRADMIAFRGFLHGTMRDFTTAHADVDSALERMPDRPWLWAERSSVLRMEDRYEEALEAAEHALKLRPFYRVAVEQVADLYYMANRDDEAIGLLEQAAAKSEVSYIVGRLSAYYSELGDVGKTLDALDRYEALTPLADKHVTQWLARRRSDLLYLKGDLPKVIELAEATDSKYHKRLAKRLEEGKHAGGKRVKLAVGFVRQHEMTCAPATLSAIAAYWGDEADHLDVAEEICYDGTPGHSERNWAESNGYVVREFCVNWEVAVALIDRGAPFTLTTVETTSAHLQALIGYDAQIGVFLIRDPTHKHFREFSAEGFLKDYGSNGPRGMVFVPKDKASLLDGIDFPEAELYDHMHALQRALAAHDRGGAAAEHGKLKEIAAGHRMTIAAERSLASYDGDVLKQVGAVDKLIKLYPEDQGFHLSKLNNMRALWSWEEKCEFVRKQLAKKEPDSVYLREMGELLADDARFYGEALYYFRRGVQRRPRDAELLYSMAGIFWDQGELERAAEMYRFATCLEPAWEYLADSYFKATRFLRRGKEGLAFLRARFDRQGGKSPLPAMTLFDAYSSLSRVGEGLEMLDEALSKRPDDGRLMLFASGKFSAYNRMERATELLEAAREKSAETAWLREAARQADLHGEMAEAEELWLKVIGEQPLELDAQQSYVRILAERSGLAAALGHLEETCAKFPSNVPLHELYVDWLNDEGPAAAEPVVRHVLEQSPTNNWARRELVLNLHRQGRYDEASIEGGLMVAAAPNESYSHSILGHVLRAKGDEAQASERFRRALSLSCDNANALRGLVGGAKSDAERREALAFVAGELKRQVIFGEALPTYREEAFPILEPAELLESLREIHAERPDLWQSWSALANQLKAAGDADGALQMVEGMVERFPLLPRSYLELAEVHQALGDTPAVIEALERALDVNPHWTYAIRQLGQAHQMAGDFEKSREVFERALAEDPLDGANYGFLAEIQWRMDDKESALETMSKGVSVQPSYGWGWEKLGDYACDLDKRDEVLAIAQKLTETRPQERASWGTLADMLGRFGRYEEQLDALGRGLELHPRTADFHDAKAYTLSQLDRLDEAMAACRPAIYGDDLPRTLRGREAWLLWQRGDKAEGLKTMQRLVEDEPDYYWAIKSLCDWLHEEKDFEKALIWAPRLVRLAPDDAVAHGYFGQALEAADRKDEACESYSRAFQIDPEYTFGAYGLFDLQLEMEAFDAAETTVERMLVHLPDRYSRGRLVKLDAKRDRPDAAFAGHAEICRDPDVSPATLAWIDGSLDEMAEKARVTSHYEQLVAGGDVGFGTAERWVVRSIEAGVVRVDKSIVKLEPDSSLRKRAWGAYFEAMAQRDEKDSSRGLAVFKANKTELVQSTETWEQVGYYLAGERKHRLNIGWMSDWASRENLSQWALMQLARSLETVRRNLNEGATVRRYALEKLEPDHTLGTHQAMVAFSVAAVPGGEEFDRIASEIKLDDLNGFYQFCFEMGHVVRQLRKGGGGRKAAKAAYIRAVEAEPNWQDSKTLGKVQQAACGRSILRALPGVVGIQMIYDFFSALCNFSKK